MALHTAPNISEIFCLDGREREQEMRMEIQRFLPFIFLTFADRFTSELKILVIRISKVFTKVYNGISLGSRPRCGARTS